MKFHRKILSILLALMLLAQTTFALAKPATAVSTQDFYFTDFTADYYLTKAEDGTSKLHVKEVLTAVFPESNQNHGITREIPATNQGGDNKVIANKSALNLKALRNGQPENINDIEYSNGSYLVYLGSASTYVHGEQVYTLEYDFTDVITEFTSAGVNVSGRDDAVKAFQELYWDSNGTGWSQRFDRVTANLHLESDAQKNMLGTRACYVGRYGESGEERCTITEIADGLSFTASDLARGENLTFVIGLKPDTFKVILEKNYWLIVMFLVELAICAWVVIRAYRKWVKKAKTNSALYKSTFVAPQYQAPAGMTVAEGEQLMLKSHKNSYVATLLELAVAKKVSLQEVEGESYDWAVILNVPAEELTSSQRYMLRILADQNTLEAGMKIPVKKHLATSTLASYASSYESSARTDLKSKKLLVHSATSSKSMNTASRIVLWVVMLWFLIPFVATFGSIMLDFVYSSNGIVVGGDWLPFVMFALFVGTIVWRTVLSSHTSKFSRYTEAGIKSVRYLDGLELYIKMAEADRLAFLQSVQGVDTSNQGIVKLYEKLLPWACLFGQEKSWAKELSKYYEIADVQPTLDINIADAIIYSHIINSVNTSIARSTSYSSSSGGSSSSFSGGGGGGGGGFSGGGGGGGGGGGW